MRRIVAAALLVCVLAGAGLRATSAALATPAALACGDSPLELALPSAPAALSIDVIPSSLHRTESAKAVATLVVEEIGRELEWSSAPGQLFLPIESRPPRLGIAAHDLTVAQRIEIRAVQPGAYTRVRLQLHCAPASEIAILPDCIARAQHLLVDDSADVETGKPALCQALQIHAAATRASRRAKPAESLNLYRLARIQWATAGDSLREAGALLGAAEQATRLGQFAQALDLAAEAERLNRKAGNRYFAVRAGIERCIAQRNLGRALAARRCLEPMPAQLEKLEEWNDAANNYANLAQFALDDGRPDDARQALRRAANISNTRITPLTDGRLARLHAALAADEGRISDAIAAFSAALTAFEKAKDSRWQANIYLDLAELYRATGAAAEASVYVNEALKLLPPDQAAARTASALWLRARIAQDSGDSTPALSDLRTAQSLFISLDMPLAAYEVELDAQDWSAAQADPARLSTTLELPPRLRWRRNLLAASQALRIGDMDAVNTFISESASNRLTMDAWLSREMMQARLDAATGRTDRALARLRDSAGRITDLASRAQAPALRQMTGRRLVRLRKSWIEIVLQTDASTRPALDAVWQMAARTQPRALLALSSSSAPDQGALAFERALARELKGTDNKPESSQLATQRALLPIWSRASRELQTQRVVPTLAEIQNHLPAGALILIPLIGEQRAAVMYVSQDNATIGPTTEASTLIQAAASLTRLAANRDVPLHIITNAAVQAGKVLMPEGVLPPQQLLIVEDPALTGFPYSATFWPGTDVPLVETTPTSVITVVRRLDKTNTPATVNVFMAAPTQGTDFLPQLEFAQREAQLIRAASPQQSVRLFDDKRLLAVDFISKLATRNTWVHVIAHGQTRGGLQGYSGLWLPSAGDGEPDRFMSWLSVGGKSLEAELLVLNACELADSRAAPAAASIGFAEALSIAGVNHVIAGRWALSDSATAVWLTPFYTEAARSGASNISSALRDAQQMLRSSRRFSHPFYWASLTHFSRGFPPL